MPGSHAVPASLVALMPSLLPASPADGGWTPLEIALRSVNFDPTTLLPGLTAPYVRGGHTWGVPYTLSPWAVQWRADAFSAAGMHPPGPNWTWDDFLAACGQLKQLAQSGRLKGLAAALVPLWPGWITPTHDPSGAYRFTSPLFWEGLWQNFIWGFGGSIVTSGKFRLTDRSAVAGIQNLVDLAHEFSLPNRVVAAQPATGSNAAWNTGISRLYALTFSGYDGRPAQAPWRWARMPRFPTNPAIATASEGLGLSGIAEGHGALSPTAPETLNAARFITWLHQPGAARLLGAAGLAPVAANPSEEGRFWRSHAANGAGDFAHFQDMYAGFPLVPPQGFMQRYLLKVFTGQETVPTALAAAEKQLNNLLPAAALSGGTVG